MYPAAVSTPSSNASTETPSHLVPSFDHLVTQWISLVISSEGSCLNSSQVHRLGSSISPTTERSHSSSGVRGVGPAESTGKPSSRYCPGGSAVSWLLRIPSTCCVSYSPLLSPECATLPMCNRRGRRRPGLRRSDPGSPPPAPRARRPAPAA